MKKILLALTLLVVAITLSNAQSGREVHGTVIDSTKQTLPGSAITLTSEAKDSVTTGADANGKFVFPSVKGTKITITVQSIGYQTIKKHFTLSADNTPADIGVIVMKTQSNMLNQVNIVGVIPVRITEDTVEYK